jgi:hypothetical protein
MKILRIIFTVLNDRFSFIRRTFSPDFLIGKIGGHLIIRFIGYLF